MGTQAVTRKREPRCETYRANSSKQSPINTVTFRLAGEGVTVVRTFLCTRGTHGKRALKQSPSVARVCHNFSTDLVALKRCEVREVPVK